MNWDANWQNLRKSEILELDFSTYCSCMEPSCFIHNAHSEELLDLNSCQPSALHVEPINVALHLTNDLYRPTDQVLYLISFLHSEDPYTKIVPSPISLHGRA